MKTRSGNIKDGRTKEQIRELSSEFLAREAGPASLITVTNVDFDHVSNSATIQVTVFPDHKQAEAIDFLKRKRSEVREYIKENSALGRIPFLDFVIDSGEKNRQRIDELSNMA